MGVLGIGALCLLPLALPLNPLTGTIRSLDGAPVPGARVVLQQDHETESATTDATGAFAFPNATLPAMVEVAARGFEPARRLVSASPAEFVLVPAGVTASVVVTADRPAAWLDPVSGATVLARSDLETLPAKTLDEALRVVSGFSLFRRSSSRASNPTTQGVTMRGLSASGSSRGLVLLDGVPLNDGFGGWVTWTRLPPAAIERVDVERGAQGETFGTDALGGVIRIVSPAGGTRPLSAGVEAGSPRVGSLDLSAGRPGGTTSMFGAAEWFRTDGAIPLAPESRGAVDRPANAEWTNAFGRVDVAASGRRLTLGGWGGRDDRGNGTVRQVNRMNGGTFSASFDALGSSATFAARVSTSPNSFYQTFTSVPASRATETLTSTQTINPITTRTIVEYGRNLPRGHAILGAALTRERSNFEDQRPASTSTESLRDDSEAVSAQVGFALAARLTVGGGLRHEWRAAPNPTDSRAGATVGRFNASWRPAGSVSFRGSVATSHRWPTLNELVRNFQVGSVLTLANPDLKPERAVSFDGALGIDRPRWQVGAGAFHTVVGDIVANVTQGANPNLRKRNNAGEAHVNGLELTGEVRPAGVVRVRASATLIDAHLRKAPEPALVGKVLSQVPRVSFSLATDVRLPRAVDASLVWHEVSSQFDDDRNQFTLAGASQLDLRVGGRSTRHVGWYVVVENATNARIEVGRAPLLTLAPPRAARVGVTWR